MIIIACSHEGCKEFYLPCLKQGEYTIVLDKALFALKEQTKILLECVSGEWRLIHDDGYLFTDQGTGCEPVKLADGAWLLGSLWTGDKLSLLVVDNPKKYEPMVLGKREWNGMYELKRFSLQDIDEITIGKSESNHICFDGFGFLSRNHAVLQREDREFEIRNFSANGTFVNHRRINGTVKLTYGDVIFLFGLKLMVLGNLLAACAICGRLVVNTRVLLPYEEILRDEAHGSEKNGGCYFKPAPRTGFPKPFQWQAEIEGPPPKKEVVKRPLFMTIGPAFTMMIPMVLGSALTLVGMKDRGGGGIYLYTGAVTAVSSALLGTLWAGLSARYGKREADRAEQTRCKAYQEYLSNMSEFLDSHCRADEQALRRAYPAADVCCGYNGRDVRLWNRNFAHPDVMYCRLGLGELPVHAQIAIPRERMALTEDSLIQKPAQIKETYKMLKKVPVGADLLEFRFIGLTGNGVETARRILIQLAANTCYTDVKLAVFCSTEEWREWEFVRWLPHIWRQDREFRYLASNAREASDLCYELGTVFRTREEQAGNPGEKVQSIAKPHFVVVIACASYLEGEPAAKYFNNPRKEYGLIVLYLAQTEDGLPNHCEYMISNANGQGIISQVGGERTAVSFDNISADAIKDFFKRLSSVRVRETQEEGVFAKDITFFELYEVKQAEELNVIRRWSQNCTYENMKALIGRKAGGNSSFLDIHEKYHGPHGLIAGTTGSGKSELLQTYILSLAVCFSPEDVNFFLIDFKGGGMANLFGRLPHLAGQISNLSGSQIRRAMISIKSENRRRQMLFEDYGVNNINAYTRLYKGGDAKIPVAHLLIIIDEFAELKREEPEFMQELISVAQVGRSLGVHLILATQKPGGIVDDNIWSNTRFRICLRVQDRQDSSDVLHRPDAAYLTGVGSGYLQVGNDEIYEQFQAAWSGGPCKRAEKRHGAVLISRMGRTLEKHGRNGTEALAFKDRTQLEAVVEYLALAAEKGGFQQPFRLWLPALPFKITLDETGDQCCSSSGEWELEAYLGRMDDPENQTQPVLRVNLAKSGHMAVCGGAFSGKSTFLQTFVYSLIARYPPDQLHLYLLDFGSRMLGVFEHAPHVGGVVYDNEPGVQKQFFCLMDRFMEERGKHLAGGSYGQYRKSHQGKTILPAVVVVLDNYAAFREKTDNQYETQLIRLAREGTSLGIFLSVSCSGFGASQLPNRIADNIKNVYALEMGDRFQYGEVLRCPVPPTVPDPGIKGRGLTNLDGRILEFQAAVCLSAENDYIRAGAIEQVCVRMLKSQQESGAGRAARIPRIPEKPLLEILQREKEYQEWKGQEERLLLGYSMEDASFVGISLKDTFCFLILGGARTGKTNLLKVLISEAKATGGQSFVVEHGSKELQSWAAGCGAAYIEDSASLFRLWSDLTPELRRRSDCKKRMEEQGMDEEEIGGEIAFWEPIYVFIADLAAFVYAVYHPGERVGSMSGFMETLTLKGRLHRIFLIAVLKSEKIPGLAGYGVYRNMAACSQGILMGGNAAGQRNFDFSDLPYSQQAKKEKTGIGLSRPEGEEETRRIAVPLARKQEKRRGEADGYAKG